MRHPAIAAILFFSVISLSCFAQTSFSYEITGHIKGLGNDSVYLNVMNSGDKKPEQIVLPASNGSFDYEGSAAGPAIVWAQTTAKRSENGNFTFFIEKGKIKIEGTNDDLAHTKVSGTAGNDDYFFANSRMNQFYTRRTALQKELKAIDDVSQAKYKSVYNNIALVMDSLANFQENYVAENPNSLASGMLLYLIADNIPVTKLEAHYLNLGAEVKQLAFLAKMPVKIEGKKRSVIGSAAPDFLMNDVNGNPVKLSDYKGRYVLLDFWASWCVPCRKENPFVKAAYEKFKGKNFEIIGVSVDEDGTAWQKAVEKDGLPWIHISDLKKNNQVAELYGVQPIPDNFLIDPSGKIIERGLHGADIVQTLTKILE